jgi:hypothetical protein
MDPIQDSRALMTYLTTHLISETDKELGLCWRSDSRQLRVALAADVAHASTSTRTLLSTSSPRSLSRRAISRNQAASTPSAILIKSIHRTIYIKYKNLSDLKHDSASTSETLRNRPQPRRTHRSFRSPVTSIKLLSIDPLRTTIPHSHGRQCP